MVAARCEVVAGPPACLPKSGASCPLHLSKVLQHWRRAPASLVSDGCRALRFSLKRCGCRTWRRRC